MSTEVVNNYIRKSADKRHGKGLPSKTLKSCLLDLDDCISQIVDEYLGTTTYTQAEVADWIYADSIDSINMAEVEEFIKVNLFAAKHTFKRIIEEIRSNKGGLTYHNIKRYDNLIYDFIHDINDFVTHYKRKADSTYVFLTGGKNYHTSSFETFNMARGFFYSSLFRKNPLPYKESQGMAAMCIRQSIEIKTKRILGIYKIDKTRRRASDYGFKRLFQFIEDNQSDITYNPIDFEILKKTYSWSCAYIHNGDGSLLWQTETAFAYLKTYFQGGTSTANGRTTHSIYGGFKLNNYNSLKTRLDTYVGNDYQIVYLPDNMVEAIIESP